VSTHQSRADDGLCNHIDPDSTSVLPGLQTGRARTFWPGAHLWGETGIRSGNEIGLSTVLINVQLGGVCRRVGAHAVFTGVVAASRAIFPPGVADEFTQGE